MSRFFIDRPIFAWVLAILISLAGILALKKMPVEQYPSIAPPSVVISASMPGASSDVIEASVTQVLERGLTGIDNLRYFSASSSYGTASVTLIFEPGTNPDVAQIQVQNKVQAVLPLLPQQVKEQGVRVSKANSGFFLFVVLYSENENFTEFDIGDILASKVLDPISRTNGVGVANLFGSEKAMRIWLDPEKMFSMQISAKEVVSAISAQNINVSAGQLGALPAVKGQELNATISAGSVFTNVEDFENIILRASEDGSKVLLKDVANIEIGSKDYSVIARYNGKTASGIGLGLASGANVLETADAVKHKVKEIEKTLPKGLKFVFPYDTTPFIKLSIKSVISTLIEAFVLVFIVMFLFMQNIRATFVPTIAIPVVVLGTFAILYAMGLTVNTLTMFALVISIGLLVDDAIVVVENVERLMHEEGLSPLEAARKSMDQIKGALVGIALVISAVFIPMAFFGGAVGVIYRQFSFTIIISMALSVFVALSFSPALCASMLKPMDGNVNRIFRIFNALLEKGKKFYVNSSEFVARSKIIFLMIFLAVTALCVLMFNKMTKAFLPTEDQGLLFTVINAPTGSTSARTLESVKKVENYLLNGEKDNVKSIYTLTGWGFAARSQSSGIAFTMLKDWSERKEKKQSVFSVSGRVNMFTSRIKDAFVFAFFPPPIMELGNASGFELQLLDTAGLGHENLMAARNRFLGMASKNPKLIGVRPNGLNDEPQFKLEIDYQKAASFGVSAAEIAQTLAIVFGSSYVNDFLYGGRTKTVYVQAKPNARMLPSDIEKWHVKNVAGEMVSFASFTNTKWVYGSPNLERFNGMPSVNIQGSAAPGVSSGIAMNEVENILQKMPKGIGYSWSGLSYEERAAGSGAVFLYAVSALIIFLALAALYESWSVPFAVILSVPFAIFGALMAAKFFGLNNDVYFQIALLTTVGLASKNAILIIEFAKSLYEEGYDIIEAAKLAVKQRFRPILMTSIAFILGVLPLATAGGAGSVSQNAIGISVIGGMFAATFISPFFIPMFYIITQKKRKSKKL